MLCLSPSLCHAKRRARCRRCSFYLTFEPNAYLKPAILVQQNVWRFEITINNSFGVQKPEQTFVLVRNVVPEHFYWTAENIRRRQEQLGHSSLAWKSSPWKRFRSFVFKRSFYQIYVTKTVYVTETTSDMKEPNIVQSAVMFRERKLKSTYRRIVSGQLDIKSRVTHKESMKSLKCRENVTYCKAWTKSLAKSCIDSSGSRASCFTTKNIISRR